MSAERRAGVRREAAVPLVVLLLVAASDCFPGYPPPAQRIPLPAPFPLVRGGTPVPGKGFGGSVELGDALMGQEMVRGEMLTFSALVGVEDRLSLSVATAALTKDYPDVTSVPHDFMLRGTLRLWDPFDGRASVAVALGWSHTDRQDREAQNETLSTLDLAVPLEYLLTDRSSAARFSVYGGPRFVHESYTDSLVRSDDFDGWVPGLLTGAHLNAAVFHLFVEGTLALPPEHDFRGESVGGSAIFLPSGGIVLHLGSPFGWDHGRGRP